MKILTQWLREYLPGLTVSDRQLADDLTLRGIAVEGVFDLGSQNGSLFEMDITTNRVDAMNHYGVAREASAIYELALAPLSTALPPANAGPGFPVRGFPVRIEAPEFCGRFTARVLRGVTIRPSTSAVAERFGLLGQKLISNAVDASNYVLVAMGQPTHAFDLDKVEGALIVRRARKGEKLRTLDGVERTLDSDDLVVADEKKALGLAGVMGGWDSMITAETKNILIEAAWFDPAIVRRMSRRHGIHSDASHRFERGTDFNAPPVGSALVAQLILTAGGEVAGEFTDIIVPEAEARTAKRPPVSLHVSEVQRLLGATEDGLGISEQVCTGVLTALGCTLTSPEPGGYSVILPSWRLDLEGEIDLIEEIARVYGYDRFANTLPAFSGTVLALPHADKATTVRNLFLASGYHEAISSTFCSVTDADTFAPQPGTAVRMENPLSEEASILRPSLLPGMLTMLAHNLNRNVFDAQLFETGTVFSGSPDRVEERPSLVFATTGKGLTENPHQPPRAFDFYDVKGLVEALMERFARRTVYFDALPAELRLLPSWLHPGRGARCVLDGETVAFFGQLHPEEAERRRLKPPIYLAEVYLDRLYRHALERPAARELSRFQPVRRDYSLLLPNSLSWQSVSEAITDLAIPELVHFHPAEILRAGQAVPPGRYSMLVSATFQAPDRTLQDEELQAWSSRLVRALEALGATLRV
ncbi:MAG: phenylalanine--tRNA ligase subunit beta [Acidobacteriaceae bacterium]